MEKQPPAGPDTLSSPLIIEYPFRRSLGPALSAFFTGLREGIIVGIRRKDGTVMVPPTEYDHETSEALDDLVEVGQAGVVTAWAWVEEPRRNQPLDKPFAWALVRLDGADTAMLHAVDAGSLERMSTGMRVRVRWAPERVGHINDIACFEPEAL
jgi:uncharacterized OB-fold protein